MSKRGAALAVLLVVGSLLVVPVEVAADSTDNAPVCEAGGDPVVLAGEMTEADAETYELLAFDVAEGTTRVEVGYEWHDLEPDPTEDDTRSVLDLGLWDADGSSGPDGFRGWSGSRQGLTAEGQDPVFITAADAERGFVPGPIEPGIWSVELGVGFVAPGGLAYEVTVTCDDADEGPPVERDPVDPEAVVSDEAAGTPATSTCTPTTRTLTGPVGQEMVDFARAAGLDFIPVTEYVTPAHWTELGATQRGQPRRPDLAGPRGHHLRRPRHRAGRDAQRDRVPDRPPRRRPSATSSKGRSTTGLCSVSPTPRSSRAKTARSCAAAASSRSRTRSTWTSWTPTRSSTPAPCSTATSSPSAPVKAGSPTRSSRRRSTSGSRT